MLDTQLFLLVLIIILAIAFGIANGFNDTDNAIFLLSAKCGYHDVTGKSR